MIDGKKTVEYDYSGLHPSIIYLENGLNPPKDPYENILSQKNGMRPEDCRILVKRAFNAMLNADKPLQRPPRGLNVNQFGITWKESVKKIIDFHKPIESLFLKGEGLKLQYIDSQLAEKVILYFIKAGAPILPVHDSFVVHHGWQTTLEKVMGEFFYDRYKMDIPLKLTPYYQEVRDTKD